MTLEIGFVLVVIIVMIACLIMEVSRPDIIVFFALAVLLMSGILNPAEALKGFSNEGMLTIALLFIVAGAVEQSGLLNKRIEKIMGDPRRPRTTLIRMMGPVAGLSAFLNNTPIVVMLLPAIRAWCREKGISPSKFLLPLSYATIFGGIITLIGTSTNLVIHGMMLDHGMKGLAMFDLAIVGIPAALVGILYLSVIGYRLLPTTQPLEESFYENSRDYLAEAVVELDYSFIGKTIEQAGLRNLKGLYLIEIIRGKERIMPVSSHEKIRAGDQLIFTGMISTIVELQSIKGLRLETGSELNLEHLKNGDTQLLEAVVSHQSSLLHKTIKENNFRSRYDAAVVAIHRNRERVRSKLGDVVLKPGDVLLLLAGKDFAKRGTQSDDYYLISPIETPGLIDHKKIQIVLLSLVSMILLAATNVVSMFKAALIAVLILLVTKSITPQEAKKYVHFNVLLLIASAIGIGAALEKTGASSFLAGYLVDWAGMFGYTGLLVGIYLITNLITEFITNSAAAVLMFPIVTATAHQVGADPFPMIIVLAVAASASFATPIGYQTNLIVYGPGGYKFTDYLKVGIPLGILFMLLTITIVRTVF